MSHETDNSIKAKRIASTEKAIKRQQRIAKALGVNHSHNQPHRYSKRHATNCGDSNCAMCGNPRKFYNERTLQEKKFIEGHRGTQID